MPCYYPVGTYRKDNSPTFRPCGSCIGCRLDYSHQWAVRIMHESRMHEENSFLTLTYDDNYLPEDKSISRKELQKFMKRLRKRIEPKKVRFYGCGEYGEKFSRPHYHICLFGFNFPDREIYKGAKARYYQNKFKENSDNTLYISELLGKVWKKGFHTIGEVTLESAGYVARYCTKKVTGEHQSKWYGNREPEFALMSRRPGIGSSWFEKYSGDHYPKDFFTYKGRKLKNNRYYDEALKKKNPIMYEQIKEKRRKAADDPKAYESHLRRYQKEKHRKCITKQLQRIIENG